MNILAIDPGTRDSAFVIFDTFLDKPLRFDILENSDMLSFCKRTAEELPKGVYASIGSMSDHLAIEYIQGFGMTAGQELFDTLFWSGRFCQAFSIAKRSIGFESFTKVGRRDIKKHLCGNVSAKDSDLREAILYRYGGPETALGNKKAPGPLYGIATHLWAAMGVALYYSDMLKEKK